MAVEVPVNDGLGQGVEVVHTTGNIQGNVELKSSHGLLKRHKLCGGTHLLSDIHDVPVLMENTKQGSSPDELSHDGELAGIL